LDGAWLYNQLSLSLLVPSKCQIGLVLVGLLTNRSTCLLIWIFFVLYPLMIPLAVLLSVIILVAGCGCPISMRQFLEEIASCPFINSEPTSDSAAEAMTKCKIHRVSNPNLHSL
jgi:hypothetical protein